MINVLLPMITPPVFRTILAEYRPATPGWTIPLYGARYYVSNWRLLMPVLIIVLVIIIVRGFRVNVHSCLTVLTKHTNGSSKEGVGVDHTPVL